MLLVFILKKNFSVFFLLLLFFKIIFSLLLFLFWVEDLLSVWNKDNRNEEVRFRIGEKMKLVLDLESSTVIEYKHHAISMQDMSTFRNAKAYVFAGSEEQTESAAANA